MDKRLNKKVSSDLSDLDKLHMEYPWTPGSENIRPTEAVREAKNEQYDSLLKDFVSEGYFNNFSFPFSLNYFQEIMFSKLYLVCNH